MNFENYWHLLNFLTLECEIKGHFTVLACAGVACNVYFRPNLVFFDFGGTKLDTSVQLGDFGSLLFGSILGGTIKNEAQGCCECAVILDFRLIFVTTSFV